MPMIPLRWLIDLNKLLLAMKAVCGCGSVMPLVAGTIVQIIEIHSCTSSDILKHLETPQALFSRSKRLTVNLMNIPAYSCVAA